MKPGLKILIKGLVISISMLLLAYYIIVIFFGEGPRRTADATRMADVRMIASALESYKDEHKVYPNNLEQLVPAYTPYLPNPPINPNKYCTPEQNKYKYILLPNDEFKIEFCLGAKITTFNVGMNALYSNKPPE